MAASSPYYSHDLSRDCREVLPELPPVSLVIAVHQEPLGQIRKPVVAGIRTPKPLHTHPSREGGVIGDRQRCRIVSV